MRVQVPLLAPFNPLQGKNMKEYIIVSSYITRSLSDLVTRRLNEGYQLVGGFSVTKDGENAFLYCQAMVKP